MKGAVVVDVSERPINLVRGTRDWLPGDFARLSGLESLLLDRFARAGYEPLRTPVLEFTELHERKSGAGIVAKLFELAGAGQGGVCLRPELTAGIVRAFTASEQPPALPWRVSHAGPVFRFEAPRPDRLREFQQVGVERIGDSGPVADAEVIWLADWALSEAGVHDATIRVGHVGLTLEITGGLRVGEGLVGNDLLQAVKVLDVGSTLGRSLVAQKTEDSILDLQRVVELQVGVDDSQDSFMRVFLGNLTLAHLGVKANLTSGGKARKGENRSFVLHDVVLFSEKTQF